MRTLPEWLADSGYRTGAVVSGYTLKAEACGLAGRFHSYDDDFGGRTWFPDGAARLRLFAILELAAGRVGLEVFRPDRPAAATTNRALRWLARHGSERFFLWVHYFDPHEPYEPPEPYAAVERSEVGGVPLGRWYHGVSVEQKERFVNDASAVRDMISLYEGEVAHVDAQVGRLRGGLASLGLDRRTLVVFAADHGESLGVPLVVAFPEGGPAGRRVRAQVSLLDIAPTVLDVLGLASDGALDGRSLRTLVADEASEVPRPAFAAVQPGVWPSGRSIYAVRDRGWKLVWTSPEWRFYGMRLPAREELYDLSTDSEENRNRVEESPPVLAALRRALAGWRERGLVAAPQLSEEVRRRLRGLGYVE